LSIQSEIGRELKVSELKPETVVWLAKEGRDLLATMWVVEVGDLFVHFYAGATDMHFYAVRSGADLETVADDTHARMRIYEYLGAP
jgi:hypothetical protein